MDVVMFEKYAINTMDHSSALAQVKAANAIGSSPPATSTTSC